PEPVDRRRRRTRGRPRRHLRARARGRRLPNRAARAGTIYALTGVIDWAGAAERAAKEAVLTVFGAVGEPTPQDKPCPTGRFSAISTAPFPSRKSPIRCSSASR